MPIPALLIPVLTTLAAKGLDLIGNAILTKGKDVVEKELGVNIESSVETEEGLENLRQLQFQHEQRLVELTLENNRLDFDYYKVDADDRANARAREVAIIQAPEAGWLNHNLIPIVTLLVVVGGGLMLMLSGETDVKFAVTSIMTLVLGYHFGSSRSSASKDTAISNLSKVQ